MKKLFPYSKWQFTNDFLKYKLNRNKSIKKIYETNGENFVMNDMNKYVKIKFELVCNNSQIEEHRENLLNTLKNYTEFLSEFNEKIIKVYAKIKSKVKFRTLFMPLINELKIKSMKIKSYYFPEDLFEKVEFNESISHNITKENIEKIKEDSKKLNEVRKAYMKFKSK